MCGLCACLFFGYVDPILFFFSRQSPARLFRADGRSKLFWKKKRLNVERKANFERRIKGPPSRWWLRAYCGRMCTSIHLYFPPWSWDVIFKMWIIICRWRGGWKTPYSKSARWQAQASAAGPSVTVTSSNSNGFLQLVLGCFHSFL